MKIETLLDAPINFGGMGVLALFAWVLLRDTIRAQHRLALGQSDGVHLAQHILQGVLVGLAASGLYSSVSTLREGAAADKTNRPPG